VGAHNGSFVWSLSRAVRKGRVAAFEPQPYLTGHLRDACTAARLDNIVVEAAGVSEIGAATETYRSQQLFTPFVGNETRRSAVVSKIRSPENPDLRVEYGWQPPQRSFIDRKAWDAKPFDRPLRRHSLPA